MIPELSSFAARLRGAAPALAHVDSPTTAWNEGVFNRLALELFALQSAHNQAYRKLCEARGVNPANVRDWTQIPAVPTAAFKEFELTCLAPGERTAVFHSSGTTGQVPSRHFHCVESIVLYEASLWAWFRRNFRFADEDLRAPIFLTPPPEQAPHSSLVHMFETVRQKLGPAREDARPTRPHPGPLPSDGRGGALGRAMAVGSESFAGRVDSAGAWALDFDAAMAALAPDPEPGTRNPKLILGTAFSFVHLLDFMVENNLRFQLPAGSQVMETGGYKNQSRSMPKAELHALITDRLGVPPAGIICEYGMSELSSQAYDAADGKPNMEKRTFRFPPWARVRIVSPETGREVGEGETGLVRILDLANVFSVLAVQTEDLGIRRGDGFELIGRAQLAEPRGCSLMTA